MTYRVGCPAGWRDWDEDERYAWTAEHLPWHWEAHPGRPGWLDPEWTHLAGPAVHHHRCDPRCYAYRPGWYRLADAAAILALLPGDHAGEIAGLEKAAERKAAARRRYEGRVSR